MFLRWLSGTSLAEESLGPAPSRWQNAISTIGLYVWCIFILISLRLHQNAYYTRKIEGSLHRHEYQHCFKCWFQLLKFDHARSNRLCLRPAVTSIRQMPDLPPPLRITECLNTPLVINDKWHEERRPPSRRIRSSESISGVQSQIPNPNDFRDLMGTFLSKEIHQWWNFDEDAVIFSRNMSQIVKNGLSRNVEESLKNSSIRMQMGWLPKFSQFFPVLW